MTKSLAEKSGEAAFDAQVKREEDIDKKHGLPKDLSERIFRESVRQNQASEAYNRGKKMVEQGERTTPMGDTYKKGGKTSSASKRADGIAKRGKTKGKIC